MGKQSDLLAAVSECRAVLRDPRYSTDTSAGLIELLRHPNAALSDLAGRALAALGSQAFDDLLNCVRAPGMVPWPNAVWALALFPGDHVRLLPLLRSWLAGATGPLERQCAISLTHVLVSLKHQGHPIHSDDLAACRRVLERDAGHHPAIRVHLRALQEGLQGLGDDRS